MTNKPKTSIRILTLTHSCGKEWIEITNTGHLMWKGENEKVGFGFPVTLAFVIEKFKEAGRDFDATKLPPNVVTDPYESFR